jgi:uncharacterized protein (DUF885 family)
VLATTLLVACGQNKETAPAAPAAAPSPAPTPAQSPGQTLNRIVEAYYDKYLELNPLQATFIDDHRYDDRLANDIGPELIAKSLALEKQYLDEIQKIDPKVLSDQDRLTYEIFLNDRRTAIDGFNYPGELIPINQFFSLPNFFAQLGSGSSVQPFSTYDDYQHFLGRARDFAVWMDQAITNMKQGVEKGVVQPRIVIEKAIPQLEAQITDDWTKSLFHRPVESMPDSFTPEQKAELTTAYEQAVTGTVIPAYKRLRDYLRDDYLAHTRDTVGTSALPNGEAWYAYLVKTTTTTDLTPDQIHQIGLDEVARVHAEMEAVKTQVGFKGSLQDFFKYLRTDPKFYFKEPQQLLDAYAAQKMKVEAAAPKLFSLMPKADFEIRPVEEFRAKSSAAAQYQPASPDGSRKGIFYVNTYDLKARPNYAIEAIFLHEAEPGHHFQLSIQQELTDLPRFRRFGGYTAYIEGWGLYSETLGKELGMYQDPYQYYGKLAAEMLRCIRLVTDTGMHHKGWTRDQALKYMLDNSSMPETDAVAEIERYIAIPSQALAYKVGQLRITALRQKAEQAMGDRFDVREFHARVLEDGALPLDVLESKIDRWIGH